MTKYDTPRTPPTTAPVIDPAVPPLTADEMAADGEREGAVLAHRSPADEIDIETERALRPAMGSGRGAAGETALDAAALPPD